MGVEGSSCRFLRISRSMPIATTAPGFKASLDAEGGMEIEIVG